MADVVDVNIVEDLSVDKKILKTAQNLKHKYSKKRKINEKALKRKTPLQKTFSIIFDCLCGILIVFAGVLCFSSINSKIQDVCPTFAGYSNLTILSGSMVKSGFNIGDNVVVKTVDTHTLHESDIIAFYVYAEDYKQFSQSVNSCVKIEEENIPKLKYKTTFSSLFGIQSEQIRVAAKSGSKLVFHHVTTIYQDDNGTRWFKTRGSSNNVDDSWYISENMVVGAYINNSTAKTFSFAISVMSSNYGAIVLIVPVLLFGLTIVLECFKDVSVLRLELDCIEEKRKITDDICVKNDVGFNMDNKTKCKILAQASDAEKEQYIHLLWREGQTPNSIRKYYIRKRLLLKYDEQLLQVNRKCEEMFKAVADLVEIAKFYTAEREKLNLQKAKLERRLKVLSAKNQTKKRR